MTAPERSFKGLLEEVRADLFTRSNLILLVGLLLVGYLGWGGGWKEAEPAGLVKLSANSLSTTHKQVIEADPVKVEIGEIRRADGKLTIDMTVTNNDPRTLMPSDLWLVLDIEDSKEVPTFWRTSSRPVGSFPPAVPVDVVAEWKDDGSEKMMINSLTYRKSSLDGSMGYFDPEPVAEVALR